MRRRFFFVLGVVLVFVSVSLWGRVARAQAVSATDLSNSATGCASADIVFVTSDGEAARAIETLADILAMHRWAHCPQSNYRIGVVDAVHDKVLLSLTPVTLVDLASWRDAEGVWVDIQGKRRPSYRYQWDGAFKKALEILRKNGDPNRRQLLIYAGDIAMDAHPETAEDFVRTELAGILHQYQTPEIWVLSGEEDSDFQNVKKAWEDILQGRGGFLPQEDGVSYLRSTDYLGALFRILQQTDKRFYVQRVGCGTYDVPSTSILAISWLRGNEGEAPAVTLQWKAQHFSTADTHDNVLKPVDQRGIVVTDPPVGEVAIGASQCGTLVGFAEIGTPSIEVEGVERLPQDRGQSFEGGVLRVRLTGWQGKSYLGIGKPYPVLTLTVESPDGQTEHLKFQPEENQGAFISEPLPRKTVGTYHWRIEGTLPYNGLDGGNGQWVLPAQEGGYQVYAVGVAKIDVTIENMVSGHGSGGEEVVLHDSIRRKLAVLPVVLRLQVKDEQGRLLAPQDLFEHPDKAFQAVLTNIATGEQDKVFLTPKGSFWYGEVGGRLSKAGTYRLEIYKQPPSSKVFVWNSEAPWRLEFQRKDPFFHKPIVWAVIAGFLAALFLLWLGWNVYVRTSPLQGVLEFRVAANNVLIRTIDLSAFRRRIVTLGREEMRYSLPVMRIRRRGNDSISIQAGEEVKGLDIAVGEEKPLLKGVVVRYITDEAGEYEEEPAWSDNDNDNDSEQETFPETTEEEQATLVDVGEDQG